MKKNRKFGSSRSVVYILRILVLTSGPKFVRLHHSFGAGSQFSSVLDLLVVLRL